MNLDPTKLLMWEGILTQLVSLGVSSISKVKALMSDAGLDDVTISQLTVKWDELYNRVKKASGS